MRLILLRLTLFPLEGEGRDEDSKENRKDREYGHVKPDIET